MKLLEFFGKPIDIQQDQSDHNDKGDPKLKHSEEESLIEEIFEFILNNEEIHKKHFIPVAMKIHKNPTTHHKPSIWLPSVNKGCMEFYKENQMKGDPVDIFHKEFRAKLCKKCADSFHKDILVGEYNLGK